MMAKTYKIGSVITKSLIIHQAWLKFSDKKRKILWKSCDPLYARIFYILMILFTTYRFLSWDKQKNEQIVSARENVVDILSNFCIFFCDLRERSLHAAIRTIWMLW